MMDGFLSVGLLQPQVCMTVCVSESLLQSDMSADLDWKIPTSSQEPAPHPPHPPIPSSPPPSFSIFSLETKHTTHLCYRSHNLSKR